MKTPEHRNRLAGAFLVLLASLAVFSDFLSTQPPDDQNLDRAFMPPTRLHFFDAAGNFYPRPFVFRQTLEDPLDAVFREDTAERFPLRFFEPGYRYSVFGMVSSSIHLASAGDAPFLPLGADELGRDVWARTLAGAQTSLLVVVVGLALCVTAGLIVGSAAGAGGHWTDSLLMRSTDFALALPSLYVILAIRAALPARLESWKALVLTAAIIAGVTWPPIAKGIRGLVLQLRNSPFVEAARAVGCSEARLWRVHLLPALLPYAVAQGTVVAPAFLLGEVVLSFLDVGLSDSATSWGVMLRSLLNLRVLTDFRWNMAPLVLVFATLLSLNLLRLRGTRSRLKQNRRAAERQPV